MMQIPLVAPVHRLAGKSSRCQAALQHVLSASMPMVWVLLTLTAVCSAPYTGASVVGGSSSSSSIHSMDGRVGASTAVTSRRYGSVGHLQQLTFF